MNRPRKDQHSDQQRYSLVINIQTWVTPIVGLLMLVAGLLSGYFTLPSLISETRVSTSIATKAEDIPSEASTSINQSELPSDREELMDFLVNETRHFKGNTDAPVTMIEFSDFQ